MLSSSPPRPGSPAKGGPQGTLSDVKSLLGDSLTVKQDEDEKVLGFFDDETLTRYLRSTNFDAKSASDAVQATIKWRAQNKPYVNECVDCAKDPEGHSIRMVGFDKYQRPVGYLNFWQATNRFDASSTARHMYCLIEDIINKTKLRDAKAAEQGVTIGDGTVDPGQFVWICDFDGFGVRDCSPMLMIYIVRFLAHL
ncbi:hypothetical protein HDU93_009208 [Gonapodya sp. JEL0774]|nr:hypothetical protein HDU93_009208 [Gonapodya sp. JEL0774]